MATETTHVHLSTGKVDKDEYVYLTHHIRAGFVREKPDSRKVLDVQIQFKDGWKSMPGEPHPDLRLAYNWAWMHCFDPNCPQEDPTSWTLSVPDAARFIYSGLYVLNERFATDTERDMKKYTGCVQAIVKGAYEKYGAKETTVILQRS